MKLDEVCCAPVSEFVLPLSTAETLAADFKVLSDPVRLRLLSIIASAPEGEICACDLPGPLARSQATISHHLSMLVTAGLVRREQRGKWAWFSVSPDRSEFVRAVLTGDLATST